MVAWEEFITKVMGHSDETFKLMDAAMEEARNGAAIMMPKVVWIAEKPGEKDPLTGSQSIPKQTLGRRHPSKSFLRKGLVVQLRSWMSKNTDSPEPQRVVNGTVNA